MGDDRIANLLLIAGVPPLLAGGSWLLLGTHTASGPAALAAGLGWASVCFSQAARMLARRR
ncbi:hypothetical protein V2S66_11080 [Streptomyces sp. V4-01]|uniref:Uncharacterized protein n=1 Tax=Actinacidiphila polyblastidii TaxID=3110430 RepID=A0ABU7P9L5_9ACTN|nr:hypothetical protein [Streptomyces sp. V4-01]